MQSVDVKIGSRLVGYGQPCYLITEVGTTCLGDMDYAHRLIDAAAEAGMDAVKFQMIDPEQLSDPSVQYRFSAGGHEYSANMKEMFTRLGFSDEQWRELRDACLAKDVDFFATVDYLDGVDRLEALDVPVHKMGSWDFTYRQLIEKIAATGKPLFVDLGPPDERQIEDFVRWFGEAGGTAVMFLHDFHTQDDWQINMRAVTHLKRSYPWPCGFSSPARDDDLDVAALALGAACLEKRLILHRSDLAFHADQSLEPAELKAWVARIRHIERSLGVEAVRPSDADTAMSGEYYRSICTLEPVAKGEMFTTTNVGAKRPGSGLPTSRLPEVWGKCATCDILENTLLQWTDIR